MRYLNLLFISLLLSSCHCKFCDDTPIGTATMNTPDETETLVFFDEEIQFDEGVWICNAYIKHEDNGDETVWIDFETYKIADITEARKIFVRTVERLIENLDKIEVAGPFKIRGDYDIEDLYVSMEFKSYFGRYVDPKLVGRMEMKKDLVLHFYANTGFDPHSVIFHIHREPYPTSKRIVIAQAKAEEKRKKSLPGLIEFFEADDDPSTFSNFSGE